MSKMLAIIISILISIVATANDSRILKAVNAYEMGDVFVSELNFNQPVNSDELKIDFINQTVQISIENTILESDKISRRVKHNRIKSIYAYAPKAKTVWTRIIQKKPYLAEDLMNSIDVEYKGNMVLVKISKPKEIIAAATVNPAPKINLDEIFTPPNNLEAAATVLPEKKPKAVEQILSDEIGPIAALQKKQPAAETKPNAKINAKSEKPKEKNAVSLGMQSLDHKNLKESEIPVLTNVTNEKKSSTSPVMRMIMSLIVVAIMGVGITLFTKWWTKKNTKSISGNKIRMLTQHHLGPKKSLAIVQVAGESILIGVTDHNISMIKTLSLLDEEVPELDDNTSFSKTLSASMATDSVLDKVSISKKEQQTDDEFSLTKIKDIVSDKLKDMRHI